MTNGTTILDINFILKFNVHILLRFTLEILIFMCFSMDSYTYVKMNRTTCDNLDNKHNSKLKKQAAEGFI